jgi:hypothetical protein
VYEDFIIVPGDEIKSAKIQRGLVDIEKNALLYEKNQMKSNRRIH